MKDQNEALQRKKQVKEKYYVHNIRQEVEKKIGPKKQQQKSNYKDVMNQKPIGCQRANTKPTGIPKFNSYKNEYPKFEPQVDSQINEVRLEDFLQPASNLNGLDLDVSASMQLTMRKMGVKPEPLVKQSNLLDSLDLQIAAIIDNNKGKENKASNNDSLDGPQEIPEDIKDEIQENEEMNIKNNNNWKKINNQITREEPLTKLVPGKKVPQPIRQFNKLIPLPKEDIKTDNVPRKGKTNIMMEPDSILGDSLAPNRMLDIVDVSQSTEMARLFGLNNPADSLDASTFHWVKKDSELMKNVKVLEPKFEAPPKAEPIRTAIEKAIQRENATKSEDTKGSMKSNYGNKYNDNKKPNNKEETESIHNNKNSNKKDMDNKSVRNDNKNQDNKSIHNKGSSDIKSVHNDNSKKIKEKKIIEDKSAHNEVNKRQIKKEEKKQLKNDCKSEAQIQRMKQFEVQPQVEHVKPTPIRKTNKESAKPSLNADNLSEMAPRPTKEKGGPKSKATTVFTHEDDFDVDEFIMVIII